VTRAETFEVALAMSAAAYLAYLMTNTNVQAASRSGASLDAIRASAGTALSPIFGDGTQDVRFTGYLALLSPVR
jgi:hypothetical protein